MSRLGSILLFCFFKDKLMLWAFLAFRLGYKIQGSYSLEFMKKSWNLSSNFLEMEIVWKIEIKCAKIGKSLEFFLKATTSALLVMFFFSFCSNFIQSRPLVCSTSTPWKRLFVHRFNVCIDHLFDNFESGKRNYCFGKKSGNSLGSLIPNLYEP